MRLSIVVAAVPLFFVLGCEKKAVDAPPPAEAAAPAKAEVKAEAKADVKAEGATATATAGHVHKVACGCSQGKKCANLIEHEGAFVPLESEGLGPMAFCGKKGLEAKAEGKVEGGKFIATKFELIEKK